MELSSAAQWAEVIGLITILGAAIYSWFQWLAERIMEYDEGKKVQPVHIAYKDWQPPNQ